MNVTLESCRIAVLRKRDNVPDAVSWCVLSPLAHWALVGVRSE